MLSLPPPELAGSTLGDNQHTHLTFLLCKRSVKSLMEGLEDNQPWRTPKTRSSQWCCWNAAPAARSGACTPGAFSPPVRRPSWQNCRGRATPKPGPACRRWRRCPLLRLCPSLCPPALFVADFASLPEHCYLHAARLEATSQILVHQRFPQYYCTPRPECVAWT